MNQEGKVLVAQPTREWEEWTDARQNLVLLTELFKGQDGVGWGQGNELKKKKNILRFLA